MTTDNYGHILYQEDLDVKMADLCWMRFLAGPHQDSIVL